MLTSRHHVVHDVLGHQSNIIIEVCLISLRFGSTGVLTTSSIEDHQNLSLLRASFPLSRRWSSRRDSCGK